jgi:hypothetical protein
MRSPCCDRHNVARQRIGRHVPEARNTQATIEELLDPVYPMESVSYQILIMY